MSGSSVADSSRCLRLERLENRSLLAGGLMAVGLSEFANLDGGIDRLDQSIPNHHAPALNNTALNNTALNNAAKNNANQARAGDVSNRGRQQTPARFAAGSQQQQQLQRPDSPPLVTVNAGAAGNTANVVSAINPSDASSPPRAPGVDAVLASLSSVSSDSSDVADGLVADATVGEVSTINTADSLARASLSQTADSSGITTPDAIDFDPSQFESARRGGTVDLTPLLSGPVPQANNSSEEAWELNREMLPRLKQAIEITPEELAQLADKVAAQWFGGPGGMVAVDHVQLPSGRFALDNAIVDIHLESTVMLYRSFDLFTASVASPLATPITGQVLDAIMETLGKLAESEVQPVDASRPIRVSTIAYPTIAVAVTGVAVSARQRSKKSESMTTLRSAQRPY